MLQKVSSALLRYLELGGRRSLKRLAADYARQGTNGASLATLKRWSSRYSWQSRVAAHDRMAVTRQRAAFSLRVQKQHLSTLQEIELGKEQFRQQVLLDPADRSLSDKRRRMTLKSPTLRDFHTLIKIEQQIIDGIERSRSRTK